ncbi:AAA family ATPase [Candidatus Woesearchaeota archaeon]|nr:AAA family ATPase [Candidatus Woesearchaeota archaeon]
MSISFKTFNKIIPHVIRNGWGIMLRCRHGVGKSEVVYQIAKEMNLPVVERRASQMTEGDLLGLPSQDGETTSFLPLDWFMKACKEPVVLFFDEIDRAILEVRQGLFELTDSRKIAGNTLHPDTLIFAAVNGGEGGDSDYQVATMDPAELDRWTVFDLEPTVEDWLNWGRENNVNKHILNFINDNHNHLEHKGHFDPPGKIFPSRRSWKRLSDCLNASNIIKLGEENTDLYNIAHGFVGMEAALALHDFLKTQEKELSPAEFFKDNAWDRIKTFELNEHIKLVDRLKLEGYLTRALKQEEVDVLKKYLHMLLPEVYVKLFNDICDNFEDNGKFLYDDKELSIKFVEALEGLQ